MKTWCRHIVWKPYERNWWVLLGGRYSDDMHVDRGFKFCPICGKKRPTKKKGNTQ